MSQSINGYSLELAGNDVISYLGNTTYSGCNYTYNKM